MSQNRQMHRPGRGMGGGGMHVAEKTKDFKRAMHQLILFCKKFGFWLLAAFACAAVSTVFTILGPDKLRDLTNEITAGIVSGINTDAVLTICFTLVIYYSISLILGILQGVIMTNVTQGLSKDLRSAISVKINKLPIWYYNKTTFGDVLSRVTNDVDTIGDTMHRSVIQLVSAVFMFFGSLIMMFRTNWIMALTAIISSLVGFVFMSLIMGKSQHYFAERQKWLGQVNGCVEEVYSGHNIVKVFNAERQTKQEFDELNGKLYNSDWKSQFLSGLMMPIMNFIGNFGYVCVCVVGAVLTMNDMIDFGVIVAFMVYVRLFTNPLSQMAQAFTSLQTTAAASERVFEFLGAEEMSDESEKTAKIDNVKGEVVFDHVRFGYEDSDKIVIHDFSEHVLPGQKIAIVGPTGAGKTTMVNLLMRFHELKGGKIFIDGVNTADMKRSDVHNLFGMVLQDTWLFEGTLFENIAYCRQDVTLEDVRRACVAVGLDHFISTLPHGYQTVLDDKMNLSAGQKQLLTIARAMVQNAPMLILDEATSSVDTRTEELIQIAMDKLTQGRTSFVIAHRLSTIKNADKILVIKDGDIIESGTHDQLLEKGGFYAELYNSQFESA